MNLCDRAIAALALPDELLRGVAIRESSFFNRFGQRFYRKDRGRRAGSDDTEVSIHRGPPCT
jgi:hypothetical protein